MSGIISAGPADCQQELTAAFATLHRDVGIEDERLYNLYVYLLDGTCLFDPERPDFVGKNLTDVTDTHGRKSLRQVMAAVNDPQNPHGSVLQGLCFKYLGSGYLCPNVCGPSYLGASLLFAGSFMICTGLKEMLREEFDSRATFTVGISLIIGLSTGFMPELYARFPDDMQSFFSDPMATTTLFSVLLYQIFNVDRLYLKKPPANAGETPPG